MLAAADAAEVRPQVSVAHLRVKQEGEEAVMVLLLPCQLTCDDQGRRSAHGICLVWVLSPSWVVPRRSVNHCEDGCGYSVSPGEGDLAGPYVAALGQTPSTRC